MAASAPKSLSEIVRERRDLCVNPLFWTSALLDVLGCSFENVALASDETEPLHPGHEDTNQRGEDDGKSSFTYWHNQSEAEQLAESFARSSAPRLKSLTITNILTSEGGISDQPNW